MGRRLFSLASKFRLLSFTAGVVLGVGIAVSGVAMAVGIDVTKIPVKFIVNGDDRTPANNKFNNNGSIVDASFIYNGTTYVPIRMVSEMLNIPITWDGPNQAIRIGAQPTQGTVVLTDVDPYHTNSDTVSNNDDERYIKTSFRSFEDIFGKNFKMKTGGKEYVKGISFATLQYPNHGVDSQVDYNLYGQYSSFTCLAGMDDKENQFPTELEILGDGKVLWAETIKPGDLPKQVGLNVTGVLQLTFKADPQTSDQYDFVIVDIVDPVLKK